MIRYWWTLLVLMVLIVLLIKKPKIIHSTNKSVSVGEAFICMNIHRTLLKKINWNGGFNLLDSIELKIKVLASARLTFPKRYPSKSNCVCVFRIINKCFFLLSFQIEIFFNYLEFFEFLNFFYNFFYFKLIENQYFATMIQLL